MAVSVYVCMYTSLIPHNIEISTMQDVDLLDLCILHGFKGSCEGLLQARISEYDSYFGFLRPHALSVKMH
jgi:hypothetical protein